MNQRIKTLWKHPVKDDFSGSFLDVVGDKIVFRYSRSGDYALRALDAEGRASWEHAWPDFDGIYRLRGANLYTGGTRARCVSVATGEVLVERDLGREAQAQAAKPSVAYRTEDGVLIGLDPESLSTVWEWPDADGNFVADDGRVCRYLPSQGITIIEPRTRAERTIQPERELPWSALHFHLGNLWCHLGLTEGGRTAIDLETGRVVWHEAQPAGYGLVTIDGERAYSPFEGLSAYDLRDGRQLWSQRLSVLNRAHISNGRAYIGGGEGSTPLIFVVDCATGEVLVKHRADFKLTGLGFEPSPVIPMGDDRIIVGTRRAILCLELS